MRMRMTLLALACGCCSLLSAQQSTYQSLFDKAMKYVSKDSLQQAESYFMKAMKLEPTNPHNALIFSNIGNIQIRAGERKKAIESYSMALNTMPDLAEAIRQRATLYMQENDYNKAYIDYSHLLDIDANDTTAMLYRAFISKTRRDYKQARNDYENLIRLAPGHLEGNLGLALLDQKEKRYRESMDIMNRLIERYPSNSVLYSARADIEVDMGNPDLALLDLESAIKWNGKNPDNYIARAQIYVAQKKKTFAKKDLDKAVILGVPRPSLKELYDACK